MEGKEKVENMWVTFNRGSINRQELEDYRCRKKVKNTFDILNRDRVKMN